MLPVAILLSAWMAWRWLGFVLGAFRASGLPPELRGEARRTVVARGAYNVVGSVVAVYVWSVYRDVQPGEAFVGFLAAATMCSLAIAIIAAFMQPAERSLETLDVCRVLRRRRPSPR